MNMLNQFSDHIMNHGPNYNKESFPKALLLHNQDDLEVYYAPFEHVNTGAKIVFCGITPGAAQAEIALNSVARSLKDGRSPQEALKVAKQSASFAGVMRKNLAKLLDHVGVQDLLGIGQCSDLFSSKAHLVHYTSALKNPVFYRGSNYAGSPSMLKTPALAKQVDDILAKEVTALSEDTLYIPLGPKVAEALHYLVSKGLLKEAQVLDGLPHPSGANAERIAYFCGEKPRDKLSSRTNPNVLDAAKNNLMKKIDAAR